MKMTGPKKRVLPSSMGFSRAGGMALAPGTTCTREPAVDLADLCSTETPKPGRTAPKTHCYSAVQGKESILLAQPQVLSSQQFYHPNTCSFLALHPRQAAKAGVLGEQGWSSTSSPGRGLLHSHCDPRAATFFPHIGGTYLSSSASSPASKPGVPHTPEPQHPHARASLSGGPCGDTKSRKRTEGSRSRCRARRVPANTG